MTNEIQLDEEIIKRDVQTVKLLEEVADAIVGSAQSYTRVPILPDRGPVEFDAEGPEIIIGAHAAAAVSVEVGTRYRYASAPIRKAAMAQGLNVPP